MAEIPVPITTGSGAASIAADVVSNISYQQVKVVDGTLGSNTALIVNSDGTANVRISGSVATAGGTFTGSVSGTVGASIIGIAPVFIVGGSIAGTFTTPNQSVSGTVGASIIGLTPIAISGYPSVVSYLPSVVGSFNDDVSNIASRLSNNSNGVLNVNIFPQVFNGSTWDRQRGNSSIGALVSTASSSVITITQGSVAAVIIGGSIAASFTPPANQSVSGTVGASVIGTVPVVQSGTVITSVSGVVNTAGSVVAFQGTNPWTVVSSLAGGIFPISGSVAATVTNFPTNQNVSGSVVATQGTNPWIITGSVQGSFTPAANQSVSGTVGASIIGLVPVSVSNFPTNQNVSGSVVATQGTNPWIITGSVQGSFSPAANQSVSGTVQVDVRGSVAVAIISGSIAASFTPPANQSVSGTVNIGTGGPVSVLGTMSVLGTVPVTQATTPWITNFQNSSIIAIQSGSVVSLSVGSVITVLQSPSIVGTYAEDAGSTSGDKGLFVLGVRNDTLASVTSTDFDYSTFTVGPSGEQVTTIAPYTKWVQGQTSVMYGASVAVLPAQGASIFTYMTGLQITNMSANNALVTISAGTNSILGFTIAPANGGSNIIFGHNALRTPTFNKEITASISGVASVYLSAQGFIAKI